MKRKYLVYSILLVLVMVMTACSTKEDEIDTNMQQESEETMESEEMVVDTTVPEEVKNYKAPTEIGDNLFDYNFKLEGVLYTLPCPVSELLKNGFEIEERCDLVVEAGGKGSLYLQYNGQIYECLAYNRADYNTIIENCWVGSVKANSSNSNFDLEVINGIKLDMTGEELRSRLEGIDYIIEDEEYYIIENPSNPYDIGYEFVVYDDVIWEIELDRYVQ